MSIWAPISHQNRSCVEYMLVRAGHSSRLHKTKCFDEKGKKNPQERQSSQSRGVLEFFWVVFARSVKPS